MVSGSAETDLACPLWVKFFDPETQLPYFHNVQTHERATADPDERGELCCIASGTGTSAVDPDNENEEKDILRTQFWAQHPARVQVEYDPKNKTAYVQGQEEYNVWFGKHENDRHDKKDKEPASFRLNPYMDCGWTKADWKGAENGYFCFFFARGCCSKGHQCKYHHHIPIYPDGERDIVHDIFGRERYSSHRDDMGGVGSFNAECRTLFLGMLVFDRAQKNALQLVEKAIWEDFGVWGEIEEVRVISNKGIAFVRYAHRAVAEFAKVAMASQKLGIAPLISVKWAHEDPNPQAKKKRKAEMLENVDALVDKTISTMGLSEIDVAGLQLQASNIKSFTAPYPDTSSLYAPKANSMGPATQDELEAASVAANKAALAVAEQAALNTNVDRLSAALAKVDAMHGSGHLEATTI